jgi:carbamoyltransferase
MEFGPRALGNRSIIADPRHPDMQKRINAKIKFRESFRPFAPCVLEEDVQEYFDFDGKSPYMLIVKPIKNSRRKNIEAINNGSLMDRLWKERSDIPSVTHVDYSARVQTVSSDTNPLFYQLLESFKRRTGYALLINTSFNVKDEPIVCSPDDAIRCFNDTEMDILVMERMLFNKI